MSLKDNLDLRRKISYFLLIIQNVVLNTVENYPNLEKDFYE